MAESLHAIWRSEQLESTEYFQYGGADGSRSLKGRVIVPHRERPMMISYQVETNLDWSTASATIRYESPELTADMTIARVGDVWTLNDEELPHLRGCTDIDLGWTPATNTLPIRRLDLASGETTEIEAAWLRFPELDVIASAQTYQRIDEETWEYRSNGFTATLVTDEGGFVRRYGDGLWTMVAVR